MCYNCGCQMPDNDMGNENNITEKTFEEAAEASGQSVEEAKRNVLQLLKSEVGDVGDIPDAGQAAGGPN